MSQRPSPLTIRPKNLAIALLISIAIVSFLAIAIARFYHPIMVWLNHGQWCADVNAEVKVQAVHYGADCDMSSYR
jgi:type II secretory pathway component PulJ